MKKQNRQEVKKPKAEMKPEGRAPARPMPPESAEDSQSTQTDFEEAMAIAEDIMKRFRNALRELAK